ncbi:unnamed protein product [Spirodela intermedia]|uniref:Uncharacterized protein n=1 Tax=Spirodela intermedia TaxID=51605 RepID=A0A7I8LEW3_SPIIN|nr:unnamed protein product [Spirodela intermedia]
MASSSHLIALFVKLAAASVTGAMALLAFRRHLRDEALSALRRDIRISLLRMRADVPEGGTGCRAAPAAVVLGFPSHGKSSFVNTAWRALAGEEGPFLARAETGPSSPVISARRVFRVAVVDPDAGWLSTIREGEREADDNGAAALDLVDSPGLPEAEKLTRADVEAALSLASPSPECILLVLRCSGPQRTNLRRLQDIAAVIRERGLHLVVVLTHRNSLRSAKQSEELRREVALRAKTDSVYLIENYTATAFKDSFSTHCNALAVIRQCVEFAAMHRQHRASAAQKSSPPSTLGAQKSVFE